MLIELFSLDVTAEVLRANVDWKSAIWRRLVSFDPLPNIFCKDI